MLADHLRAAGRDAESADRLALLSVTAMEGALVLARAARSDQPILETGEAVAAMMDSAPQG